MKAIAPDGFEAMFRSNVDPWNYATSPFEAFKRGVLLRACGDRFYARGLELACANGETTRALAPRCRRLLAVDAAPTVVAEAQRRTQRLPGVTVRHATLPADMPRGPFDLIVASEILYYLQPGDFRRVLRQLLAATAPGGRIVVLHHLKNFADASQPPALAQARARDFLTQRIALVFAERHGRFEALAFERGR